MKMMRPFLQQIRTTQHHNLLHVIVSISHLRRISLQTRSQNQLDQNQNNEIWRCSISTITTSLGSIITNSDDLQPDINRPLDWRPESSDRSGNHSGATPPSASKPTSACISLRHSLSSFTALGAGQFPPACVAG